MATENKAVDTHDPSQEEAVAAPESMPVASAMGHAHNATKSPGEKMFDTITYKGIGWLGTAALGIYIAQTLEHGNGRPLFDKYIDYLTPKYQSLMRTDEKVAREAVSSALTHMSFVVGGSLPVYPMKVLEGHKADVVRYIDHRIDDKRIKRGNAPTEEELNIQHQAYERITAEPKQNWSSLLTGRALGVGVVFIPGVFLFKGQDKKVLENIAEKITDNKQAQSLGVLTALELGYSFISEEVLHFTSHMYAQKKYRGDDHAFNKLPETPSAEVRDVDITKPQEAYHSISQRA